MAKKGAKKENIGEMVDRLYAMRADRLELQRQADDTKKNEVLLRQTIIAALKEQGLAAARGNVATGSIKKEDIPKLENSDKFFAYVKKNDAWHLLHKRVTIEAWRELHEAGKKVPGVEAIPTEDLSLTKATKG